MGIDKDRIEGKVKDIKGRIKRQVGEWTGDEKERTEGAAEQVKGKIQNAWGKMKDAGRNVLEHGKKDEQMNRKQDEHKKDDSAA